MTARILTKTAPWRYEIRFRWPDRSLYRERRLARTSSKSAAQREADARESYVRAQGKDAIAKERAAQAPEPAAAARVDASIPTLRAFAPRWIEGHAKALRQKKSGIDTKGYILKNHLYPALGDLRLDQITTERVARLTAGLGHLNRKTLGNILAVLAKLLRTAVEWDVLAAMPCKIKIPKATRTPPAFYEQEQMRRLIDAAAAIGPRTHVLILLGLHAGLRRSEILGLEWEDVNVKRRQLVVRRGVISKYVDTPKSGHGRVIDLSAALAAALARLSEASPRTGRVLLQDDGKRALARHLYAWTREAMAKAGIPRRKGVALHVMRHSACSALAAMGAPMIAIQALAGHESPQTTQKYMHLGAGVQAAAVRLFDQLGGTAGARVDEQARNP